MEQAITPLQAMKQAQQALEDAHSEIKRLRQELEVANEGLTIAYMHGSASAKAEIERLTKERDVKDRQVARLYEALNTIASVSNDPAIVACAKRALMPNLQSNRLADNG